MASPVLSNDDVTCNGVGPSQECNVKNRARDLFSADDEDLAKWIRTQRFQPCVGVGRNAPRTPSLDPPLLSKCSQHRDHGETKRAAVHHVPEIEFSGTERHNRADNEAAWLCHLDALKAYKDKHGHCLVPARHHLYTQLGNWVTTQRKQYRLFKQGRPSTLTKERILKLNELEFVWATREEPEAVWNHRLQELKNYKAKYGNCLVPQRFSENPQLGTWVNTQRRHYKLLQEGKRSSMTPERIDALEAVGFSWYSAKLGHIEQQLDALRKDRAKREAEKALDGHHWSAHVSDGETMGNIVYRAQTENGHPQLKKMRMATVAESVLPGTDRVPVLYTASTLVAPDPRLCATLYARPENPPMLPQTTPLVSPATLVPTYYPVLQIHQLGNNRYGMAAGPSLADVHGVPRANVPSQSVLLSKNFI